MERASGQGPVGQDRKQGLDRHLPNGRAPVLQERAQQSIGLKNIVIFIRHMALGVVVISSSAQTVRRTAKGAEATLPRGSQLERVAPPHSRERCATSGGVRT